MKKKLGYATKNYPGKIAEYELKEAILGERNSYSKTDLDATFMRMKDDHMQNGQLKAAYNVQISTSNQFIVNYTLHPNPTDTTTLKLHLQQHKASFDTSPKSLTADAGYGSEENYELMAAQEITAYVKYGLFDQQQSKKYDKKYPFAPSTLHYDQQGDRYICPMGQSMNFIGEVKRETSNGYQQTLRRYRAQNCGSCPLNGACHKSKGNRVIEVNRHLNGHKQTAYHLLNSEEGVRKRKQRCYDVEPVFGNIKQNHGFQRFMLRGKEKVSTEIGLLAIAQNIRKKAG